MYGSRVTVAQRLTENAEAMSSLSTRGNEKVIPFPGFGNKICSMRC